MRPHGATGSVAALIERAFGVRPIEHYGMAEAVANSSQCPARRQHVDEDFAAVEFIPTADGSAWRVIGTNFTNRALPLIRYEVGDHVQLADKPCACGLPGRVLSSIDGRQEDYVILRNGARLGRIRKFTQLPVGVGFGIRDPETARRVASVSDAVVIGSRLIQEIEACKPHDVNERVTRWLSEIRTAMDKTEARAL